MISETNLVLFSCLFALSLGAGFHFYWAFGGRLGLSILVPQNEINGEPIFNPSQISMIAVGLILTCFISVILIYRGIIFIPVPFEWVRTLIALISSIFLIRAFSFHKYFGLLKKVRDTRFAKYDTWLYSPLCLLIGMDMFYLFLNPN